MPVLFIKVVFVSAEYSFLCQDNCFPNTTISVYGSPEGTNETFSFLVLQVLNIFFVKEKKKLFSLVSTHKKTFLELRKRSTGKENCLTCPLRASVQMPMFSLL